MKNLFNLGLILMGCSVMWIQCNPSCDSPFTLQVHSSANAIGSEVLLRTSNPGFLDQLEGRSVFVDNKVVDDEDLRFVPDFGLIVKMPEELSGNASISIEDNDCGSLAVRVNMMQESFFANNPEFIVPSPPRIVIPSLPQIFPADITNAWVSPQDPDYCLWFGPYKLYHFEKDGKILFTDTTNIVAAGSFELSACGNTDAYYHNNPFFGIVDTLNNYIEVTVDRSTKKSVSGLAKETFVGQFIDVDATNYSQGPTDPCEHNGDTEKKVHMMWLVSKETGRQLILYKLINP